MRCADSVSDPAVVSRGCKLSSRVEAEQFPLFGCIADFFEDDLKSYLPPSKTPALLLFSVVALFYIETLTFSEVSPFEWPSNWSAILTHHGLFRNYWEGGL